MHRFVNAVAVAVLTGASLSGCATQRSHLSGTVASATDAGALPGDGAVITAAVFGSLEPSPVFTVQGLLEIKGEPVTDSLVVIAVIDDVSANTVIFESEPLTLEVVDGRFTRTINLPEAQEIAGAGDLAVSFIDAKSGQPVGGALPITFAPRAWAAQYAAQAGTASTAGSASSAGTANFATTAGTAAALTNDSSVLLELEPGYGNYGAGYDQLRATRVGNMVFLSGLPQTLGAGIGTFATLPEGMRPSGRHIFSASSNGQYVRVDVLADGRISLLTMPQVGWFSVTGLSFPVAP
jgi:hypothetical protein